MSSMAARRIEVRGPLELTVQVRPDQLEPTDPHDDAALVDRLADASGGAVDRFEVVVEGWRFEVTVEPARRAVLREQAARAAGENRASSSGTLRAQIPGRVTKVWVQPGEQVEQGQRLLAVEAMKMENEVRAPHAARVEGVHVEVGSTVERDDPLVVLA